MSFELILRGGRVIDPSQDIDARLDVAFSGGRVAAVGPDLAPNDDARVVDADGLVVTPGLIDLHTHVYDGGTSLGVDPVRLLETGAVTTLVDTGSAGAGNFAGFRDHVIRRAPVRIVTYLNISFAGIYGFSKRVMVGESGDLRLVSAREAVEVVRANPQDICGIKVRVGRNASGFSGLAPLLIAREAAREAQCSMMVHIDEPPPLLSEVLETMRPGDVLTHAFRAFPNSPATPDGRVHDYVLAARKRGIIFDIGHGMGSFSFAVARTMLANGFLPDTISSDVHALCIEGPAFDLLTTLSKFLSLGVPLADVVRCATIAPAQALKRPDLGTFKPGAAGDASLLRDETGAFDFVDSIGGRIVGERRLTAAGVVQAGRYAPCR